MREEAMKKSWNSITSLSPEHTIDINFQISLNQAKTKPFLVDNKRCTITEPKGENPDT